MTWTEDQKVHGMAWHGGFRGERKGRRKGRIWGGGIGKKRSCFNLGVDILGRGVRGTMRGARHEFFSPVQPFRGDILGSN